MVIRGLPSGLAVRRAGGATVLLILAALQACQTPSSTPSDVVSTLPPPAADPAASGAATGKPAVPDGPLAGEARWLSELFAGTPVRVSGERDGSVKLSVPLKYAFDAPPAVAPKAPLQAVLDKLSQSLKRQPTAKLQASAPAGAGATERVAAVRSHLAAKGVQNWRVASAGPVAEEQMVFRLVAPPGGLRKLDDAALAPTGAGKVLPPPPSPSGAQGAANTAR